MKKLLSLILLSAPLLAQSSPNTVSQLIVSNAINAGQIIVPISATKSIGQTSHQLFGYTSDGTGGTCASGNYQYGDFFLQGSIDNITWLTISSVQTNFNEQNTNATPVTAFAAGVYPYVRAVYTVASNLCKLSLWYTASTSPNAYTGSPRTILDGFIYKPFTDSASGDTAIVNICSVGRMVVYGFYFFNSGGANTIILKFGELSSNYLTLTAFQQYAQFMGMPLNGKPYWFADGAAGSNTITLNLSAATEVDGYTVIRCE